MSIENLIEKYRLLSRNPNLTGGYKAACYDVVLDFEAELPAIRELVEAAREVEQVLVNLIGYSGGTSNRLRAAIKKVEE